MVTGKSPLENKVTLLKLVSNSLNPQDPLLSFVLMNSAALLKVSGRVSTWSEGVDLARERIESGHALTTLKGFIQGMKAISNT